MTSRPKYNQCLTSNRRQVPAGLTSDHFHILYEKLIDQLIFNLCESRIVLVSQAATVGTAGGGCRGSVASGDCKHSRRRSQSNFDARTAAEQRDVGQSVNAVLYKSKDDKQVEQGL